MTPAVLAMSETEGYLLFGGGAFLLFAIPTGWAIWHYLLRYSIRRWNYRSWFRILAPRYPGGRIGRLKGGDLALLLEGKGWSGYLGFCVGTFYEAGTRLNLWKGRTETVYACGDDFTRFAARFAAGVPGLQVLPTRILRETGRPVFYGSRDIQVGEAEFDRDFVILSPDPEFARSALDADTRGRITSLQQLASSVVEIRRGTLTVQTDKIFRLGRELREWLELSGALADRFASAGKTGASAPPQSADCPVCGGPLQENIVECGRCRTGHHVKCWRSYGSCAGFDCGFRRAIARTSRDPE